MTAQGIALGSRARITHQALKGRANDRAPFQGLSDVASFIPQGVALG